MMANQEVTRKWWNTRRSQFTLYVSQVVLDEAAQGDDAIHIAAATVHGVDYVLTWNCKHIANAQIQKKLAEISISFGYKLPTICTPYELMGE